MKIRFILSDLDGVVRKFPIERDQEIESKYDLEPGVLFRTAFKESRLDDVVCGRITDDQWREDIKEKLSLKYSLSKAEMAVKECMV